MKQLGRKIEDSIGDKEQLVPIMAGYREQSYMWRAIALLQIPITAIAILVAIIMYATADTIVDVEPRPAPGYYLVDQIPDNEFVKVAMDFVNLISSYNPTVAERQFNTALGYLKEPEYSNFRNRFLDVRGGNQTELEQIRQIQRARMFFVNRDLIIVRRIPQQDPHDDEVEVRLPGTRITFVNGVKQNPMMVANYVTMQTMSKNTLNPNGIVIAKYELKEKFEEYEGRDLFEALYSRDLKELNDARRKKKPAPFVRYQY